MKKSSTQEQIKPKKNKHAYRMTQSAHGGAAAKLGIHAMFLACEIMKPALWYSCDNNSSNIPTPIFQTM